MPDAIALIHQLIHRIGGRGHRLLPDVTAKFARHWRPEAFASKPNPQQRVNKYQADLQKAYTDWYESTADDMAEAESEDEREEIWLAALLALLALLKKMGRDNLPDAIELALAGEDSFDELDELLDDQITENDKYLEKSFIPDLRALGKEALKDGAVLAAIAAGAGAEAIGGMLAGQTARVGSYSGEFWDTVNRATILVAKEKGKAVLWYLDPQAKHCDDCPRFGSDDGKYYSSMEVLLDSTDGKTPANGVQCESNCRCELVLVDPRE